MAPHDGNSPAPNVRITDTLPISTPTSRNPIRMGFGSRVWASNRLDTRATRGRHYGLPYLNHHVSDHSGPGHGVDERRARRHEPPGDDYTNNIYTPRASCSTHADMAVSKSLSVGKPLAGTVITYQVYVANQGNSAAATVTSPTHCPIRHVSSRHPTRPISLPIHRPVCSTGHERWHWRSVITWSLGMVPRGYGTFYIGVRISAAAALGKVLTNTAENRSQSCGEQLTNNRAVYPMTIVAPL